jgi:hypothetical protein
VHHLTVQPVPSLASVGIGDTDPGSNNYGDLAQIGIAVVADPPGNCGSGSNCLKFFWEWIDSGGTAHRHFWGGPVVGTHYKFQVYNDFAQNKIKIQWDSQNDGDWDTPPSNGAGVPPSTDFDPDPVWSWIAPFAQEEIIWEPSDFMGTSSQKVAFGGNSLVRYRDSQANGGDWIVADWTSNASTWRDRFEASGEHDTGEDGFATYWQ